MKILLILFLAAITALVVLHNRLTGGTKSQEEVAHFELSQAEARAWEERVANARRRPAYLVTRSDWVQFPLPPNARHVRILSNANLQQETPLNAEADWRYAIEIQVRSLTRSVIHEKKHHLRTRVPLFVDEFTSDPYTSTFYHPRVKLIPAAGKTVNLDLSKIDGATSVRFRLTDADPVIRDMVLRVSAQHTTSDRRLRYAWNRLAEEEKDQLASSTIFETPRLLSSDERKALLSRLWHPLGPSGIENRDYARRDLFTARRNEHRKAFESANPLGRLLVSSERSASVPIGTGGSHFSFVFKLLEPAATDPEVQLIYFGKEASQRSTRTIPIEGPLSRINEAFPSRGLVEIRSNVSAEVEVFQGSLDVTPESTVIRSTNASLQEKVRYRVYPAAGARSFYRVDLRGLLSEDPSLSLAEASVHYALLDENQAVLESGKLPIDPTPSVFDGLEDLPLKQTITLPKRCYLNLAEDVREVVLQTTAPVLTNLYVQPPNRRLRQRIPEDYDKTAAARQGKQRRWFMIQPLDVFENSDSSVRLAIQAQPPESSLSLEEADYQWEEFLPEGKWKSRTILTPRGLDPPLREEAYTSVYTPIPVGDDLTVHWLAPFGIDTIKPKLLYLSERPLDHPVTALVHFGKGNSISAPLTASRGEITLPEMNAGPSHLRVDLPRGFRTFVNHHDVQTGSFLKRHVIQIKEGQSLTFLYKKLTNLEETLSGRFFTAIDTKEPTVLHVDIQATYNASSKALQEHLTITQRRLEISPSTDGNRNPLLNAGLDDLSAGQLFVLPMGSDIAQTAMPLTITHAGGPPGYIQLTRILPGLAASVYVYREDAE